MNFFHGRCTQNKLTVGAEKVTLANDAAHALKGEEIILAARDTLTLKSGSAIEAQNTSTVGQGRNYSTEGLGPLSSSGPHWIFSHARG